MFFYFFIQIFIKFLLCFFGVNMGFYDLNVKVNCDDLGPKAEIMEFNFFLLILRKLKWDFVFFCVFLKDLRFFDDGHMEDYVLKNKFFGFCREIMGLSVLF